MFVKVTGGSPSWNNVKTPGKILAKAEILSCIFSLKAASYPYASSAGATSPIKTLAGEKEHGEF